MYSPLSVHVRVHCTFDYAFGYFVQYIAVDGLMVAPIATTFRWTYGSLKLNKLRLFVKL